MKKVIILIDGQNLFYSLKDLKVLERDIDWGKFFKSILATEDELLRTYWFRPQKILDSYFTTPNIQNQIIYKEFRTHYAIFKTDPSNIPADIKTKINDRIKEVEEWLKKEKIKFSQIEYSYDQLSLEYEDVEIVKTGIVKVNPLLEIYLGEKGVDIALAVKMLSLSVEKSCDKIILISGDYDYAEAIKYIKNRMTKIHIVKFHKGFPPKNRSVSRDLAILADKVIDIYESELQKCFIKPATTK